MSESAAFRRPDELAGGVHDSQVIVKIDPGLHLLDQQGGSHAVRVVGEQLEPLPVPRQPLHQQPAVRMPVNPGDVPVLRWKIQPSDRAIRRMDEPELDPGIFRAGEGITMLLDVKIGLRLVHYRVDRDVRLVDLLECDPVARPRWPVAAEAIEFFLRDELREPAGCIRRM